MRKPGYFSMLFFVISSCFFVQINFAQLKQAQNNFYFDAEKGNDKNDGKSPLAPLRSFKKIAQLPILAGDSILLKSGTTFTEPFYFSGKGTTEKPIVIGKYGGRARPYLKGDATSLQMMHIYNSENIEIRDLEISNKGKQVRPYLNGLLVELFNYGIAKNIKVEKLYIHDVYGSLIKGEGNNDKDAGGGQAILIRNLRGSERDAVPSCFDGVIIQDCYIKDCQRNGIMVWGNWVRKYWYPSKHVVIRKNRLEGVPGDGIVPAGCDSPLVEYNVMQQCPSTLPVTEACDGIWPWSCDHAVIQYNIVSDHHSKVDGYGFDADYNCTNSLFQYNLSYHNDGGFYLLCNPGGWPDGYLSGNVGSVFQYNVSIDDGIRKEIINNKKGPFSPVIHITGNTKNSLIAHNLIIINKKKSKLSDKRIVCSDDWSGYADSTFFNNNLISVEDSFSFMEPTLSTNNFFYQNKYRGDMVLPSAGFEKISGAIQRDLYFDNQDPHWLKLVAFLKDKKIRLDGRQVAVLSLIGWNEH